MTELPIENPNLPANHQDIDNIPDIEEMDLDALGHLLESYEHDIDHLTAGKVEIRKTILERMETDSEEVGNYLATKVKKYKFKDLTLDQAEELGIVKVTKRVDNRKAKAMVLNGVDLGEVQIDVILMMRKKKEVAND